MVLRILREFLANVLLSDLHLGRTSARTETPVQNEWNVAGGVQDGYQSQYISFRFLDEKVAARQPEANIKVCELATATSALRPCAEMNGSSFDLSGNLV